MKKKDNFDRLKYDPTEVHNKFVNDTIERFKKQTMMREKVVEGLNTENQGTPKFYLRPKIHKRGNPGGPVVSTVNCHTANISKYVDYHLQPIVKEIPSYVKDTKDFTQKLNQIERITRTLFTCHIRCKIFIY